MVFISRDLSVIDNKSVPAVKRPFQLNKTKVKQNVAQINMKKN